MTIAVDLGRKATKPTNNKYLLQTLLVHCISEVRDLMQISPQENPDLSLENTKDAASQGQSDDQSLSRRSSQDSAFGERKPG